MKSIVFIIPFFGKFPDNFELYLKSCEYNSTINWLIFTDDKTKYDYPENVKVVYTTFENIQNKIRSFYDFDIQLEEPYKLCTYKPAFGQIFSEYISAFDYWGHCDVDMIWGDIRKFYTDEVLSSYDRIGWHGHSTLYRNDDQINKRYLEQVNNTNLFYEATQRKDVTCFDEEGMSQIYDHYGWDYYKEVHFAHPSSADYSFNLKHLPEEENYKNSAQIFRWDKGKLYRMYVFDNKVHEEEFMYIHFFRRFMNIKNVLSDEYIILPHSIINMDSSLINADFIKKQAKNSAFKYYCRLIYDKKKSGKLKLKYIIPSLVARAKRLF